MPGTAGTAIRGAPGGCPPTGCPPRAAAPPYFHRVSRTSETGRGCKGEPWEKRHGFPGPGVILVRTNITRSEELRLWGGGNRDKEARKRGPGHRRGRGTALGSQQGLGSRHPHPQASAWICWDSQARYVTWASVSLPSVQLHVSETMVLQEPLGPPLQGGREGGTGAQGRNQTPDRHLETAQTWRPWAVRTCVWYCEDMSTPVHARAASAQPQTPGCAARRNEVSLGESALDSHTRPGGLISSTKLGLP